MADKKKQTGQKSTGKKEQLPKNMPASFYRGQKKDTKPKKDAYGGIIPE